MIKEDKKLDQYNSSLENGPNDSQVMVIYNMIQDGYFEVGSNEWTNYICEIDSDASVFSWYELIQIAENASTIGCRPELDLLESIKLLTYVKSEYRKKLWSSLKNKKDTRVLMHKISKLNSSFIEKNIPFVYQEMINIGNSIIYDNNGDHNGNGYMTCSRMSNYIEDIIITFSKEQIESLLFYLRKFDSEYKRY